MANRYWVGGTGNWSDTSHWAYTSGGDGGKAVPTSTDDVYIDENSGFDEGGTITLNNDGAPECKSFTSSSGDSYEIEEGTESELMVNGSLILEAGLTFITTKLFMSSDGEETITTDGVVLGEFEINGTGTFTLQDDLETTGTFCITNGTFDANDNDITSPDIAISSFLDGETPYEPTVVMGSGTWEVKGIDWTAEEADEQVITITPETSTIKFTTTEDTEGIQTFTGAGKTYNNLWIAGDSSADFVIADGNTFNDFKIDADNKVTFTEDTTTTVNSFTAIGEADKPILLDSLDQENQFTLSDSAGTNNCDYLDISNSNAEGGATWKALYSIDGGNNNGWDIKTGADWTPLVYSGGQKADQVKREYYETKLGYTVTRLSDLEKRYFQSLGYTGESNEEMIKKYLQTQLSTTNFYWVDLWNMYFDYRSVPAGDFSDRMKYLYANNLL